MASPSGSLATLRPDLAGSLNEFDLEMNQRGFISQIVLPVMEVEKQAGTYGRIKLEDLLKDAKVERAPGSGYNRDDFEFDDESYACVERGVEEVIDDREAEMYSDYFDVETISTARAYSKVLLAQERRVANKLFDASANGWSSNNSDLYTDVSVTWATHATAVPRDDVMAAAKKVWEGTGMFPNALIINRFAWRDLIRCAQIIDAIEASGAGQPAKVRDITKEMVAAALDIEHIIVADSARNSAGEGKARSIAPIWSSSYAMVARICTTPDIREPGLGRIFHWGADGSQVGGAVESYRDETVRSDIIRVRHDVDEKIHYKQCAHLLKID